MLYFKNEGFDLYQGNTNDILEDLEDNSVNCVVTSPPYWGLRDYGTAQWEGGDPKCNHIVGNQIQDNKVKGVIMSGIRPGTDTSKCKKCGAIRKDEQIGLELTPEEYVQKIVTIFEKIGRVLKDDGTVWLNLGDSYAGSGGSGNQFGQLERDGFNKYKQGGKPKDICLKPKDLIGIPGMVAFALRASGGYLRQDIIWSKPNPMPESVKDRCTKSHEYIFLLSKSKKYYYDYESIKEDFVDKRKGNPNGGGQYVINAFEFLGTQTGLAKGKFNENGIIKGKNKRSVWTVSTAKFKEAHFAVFPKDLITPCIKACCPKDGVVLDPFIGSGTVALVSNKLGKKCIGIELNKKYCDILLRRLELINIKENKNTFYSVFGI